MDNENSLRNERRRRLAKKLRGFVGARGYGKPGRAGSWVDSRELLWELFDMDKKPRSNLEEIDSVDVLALADLLDRPTCRDMANLSRAIPADTVRFFDCSACGCKLRADLVGMGIRYCPRCGREVLW